MQNIYISVDERGVERSLRKFKRMCDSYGVVKQYRAKEAYSKPSVMEKEKRENAEKRRRKTINKAKRGGRRKKTNCAGKNDEPYETRKSRSKSLVKIK